MLKQIECVESAVFSRLFIVDEANAAANKAICRGHSITSCVRLKIR